MFSASPKNAGGCQAECDRAVYNMDVQFRLLGAEALKTAQELLGFKGGIVALSGKVTDHGIPGGSGRKPPTGSQLSPILACPIKSLMNPFTTIHLPTK